MKSNPIQAEAKEKPITEMLNALMHDMKPYSRKRQLGGRVYYHEVENIKECLLPFAQQLAFYKQGCNDRRAELEAKQKELAGAPRTITPESGIETTSYLMGVEDGKELAKKQLSELSNTSTIEREGLREEFKKKVGPNPLLDFDKIFDWFAPYLKDTEDLQKEQDDLWMQACAIIQIEYNKKKSITETISEVKSKFIINPIKK